MGSRRCVGHGMLAGKMATYARRLDRRRGERWLFACRGHRNSMVRHIAIVAMDVSGGRAPGGIGVFYFVVRTGIAALEKIGFSDCCKTGARNYRLWTSSARNSRCVPG